jgi:hypothetical protein
MLLAASMANSLMENDSPGDYLSNYIAQITTIYIYIYIYIYIILCYIACHHRKQGGETGIGVLEAQITTTRYATAMLLVRNVEPSLLFCHLCTSGKYHKVFVAIGSNNPVGKKVDYYPAFSITPPPRREPQIIFT